MIRMKGVYVLIIEIPKTVKIRIGALGEFEFRKGLWTYVGSAMGVTSTSLKKRILRHISKKKNIHWHVDYILNTNSRVLDVIWSETNERKECRIAKTLSSAEDFVDGPRGFGASDCKEQCATHIFRYIGKQTCQIRLKKFFRSLEISPHNLKILLDSE